jgi:hypothetical protein
MTINGEYLPTDPKYDIYIVEVDNLKLNDPKIKAPSASLDVFEVIRTNVDRSECQNEMGIKHIIGYWSRDLSKDKKSQLLNLEGGEIIIYGERVKNTSEITFLIYKHYPYTIKNIQTEKFKINIA